MSRKTKVGVVGVDSGQLMIIDPSYIDYWEESDFRGPEDIDDEDRSLSYKGACNATLSGERFGQLIRHGIPLAVASSTGYGDGVYPVYATVNDEGRIMRLTVEFS